MSESNPRPGRRSRQLLLLPALAAARPAHASFLAGDALDTAADVMSWVVLVIVPIVVITVFWLVHVLPEKFAHQRHHPQRQAIQVLCLLSLFFGGLLWPIAWLWAFTKPVAHRAAYATDKHEDYFHEQHEQFKAGKLSASEIAHLDEELDAMAQRGTLPYELRAMRDEIAAARLRTTAPAGPVTVPAEPTTSGAA